MLRPRLGDRGVTGRDCSPVSASRFSVNYSPAAASLASAGRVEVDLFKCPAWPDLVAALNVPLYVHFALRVGLGISDAIDTRTRQPADWGLDVLCVGDGASAQRGVGEALGRDV